MARNGRGGGGMLALLALHTVTEYCRMERKPPVTAGLLAANTLIYLRRPDVLHRLLPTLDQVWFNPHLILKHRDVKRLLLSAFYHIGEPHLVYNMLSLLWKGIQLESSMGSMEFASMVAELVVMSQTITLILAKSLLVLFDYGRPYYNEYAVGFSGVLFAMKVVLNYQSDNYANVYGLLVPARFAAWAELVLIQMFVPGVSFLGHLGGILAGLVYLRLKSSYSGPDPLTRIFRGVCGLVSLPLRLVRRIQQRRRVGVGVGGRGTVGSSVAVNVWRCRACTFDNSVWLSSCEMCGASLSSDGGTSEVLSGQTHELTLEELRLRRVERFDR